ncbi:glutaredoxin-related protein 5, mitochondrial-like [Teleopsis dalmanni]|uniref:glutaredoxin-related protein 5, mitochondrial-like n=1 Tax=Teleopsis dalmanni TaxID=139649 RepID=UPI0018CD2969|nr:glutaredoxin-related protein 5, mitochondrial-like [Teleopsis dalmanni]XP_037934925.1 glutaredoxin-related protein 5, mitochondrial-like [Teleopsis dalmanni]
MSLVRQLVRQVVSNKALRIQPRYFADSTAGSVAAIDKDTLSKIVRTNKVVVFMKGNPEAPRCGFSNAVVQIFRMHGVPYDAHDVLESEELRQGIKDYTEWPTIPQVFINGEFVGGCDILIQMHQSGDLIEELKKVGIESQLLKNAEAAEAAKDAEKEKK